MLENFFRLGREFYEKEEEFIYEVMDFLGEGEEIFQKLYPKFPKVLWLDSSKVEEGLARFSIFGLSSVEKGHSLTYHVDSGVVKKSWENGRIEEFSESIFDYLQRNQKSWKLKEELPFDFQLGCIGYFGYELKKETILVIRRKRKSLDRRSERDSSKCRKLPRKRAFFRLSESCLCDKSGTIFGKYKKKSGIDFSGGKL